MRLKEGSSKARGYCGWHVTWDGKKVFLRSMNEYAVACMLDANKMPYLTERNTFKFKEYSYKPDFFIYKDTSYVDIIKIIEVKHQGDVDAAVEYMDAFHAFFESIGIAYEVVYRFDALKTLYCPVDTQNLWRQHSKETTNSQAVSGENNPMFGISHRESTKRLIGGKAAIRWKDPVYRQNLTDKIKLFWQSPTGVEYRMQQGDRMRYRAARRLAEYQSLPDIVKSCLYCGAPVVSKEGNVFCPAKCERAWGYKNVEGYGRHSDKAAAGFKRVWTYIRMVATALDMTVEAVIQSLEPSVRAAKEKGAIPKHKGLSKKTLIKFKIIEEPENGEIKINYDYK